MLTPRSEVRVEVERGLWRRHPQPGRRKTSRGSVRHPRVQGAAAGNSLGYIWGFSERESRCPLDGHRGGRPYLAADSQQPVAQAASGRAVWQPCDADPPAAEGQALAERGRDYGPFRRERRWAREGCPGIVDQVAVDLIGDDDQVIGRGDVAEFA